MNQVQITQTWAMLGQLASALVIIAETQAAILDTIEGIQRQLAALTPQPTEADAEAEV